jgi:5-amino-6-(5-phospho-D-ribitylamino)uracil phosphatase
MNNQKRCIVLDLDGTLLTTGNTYDKETFAYLKDLNDKGYILIIATGRPWRSSQFVYEALNLNTPIINYNGSYIHSPKDVAFPILDKRISKEDLLTVYNNQKPSLLSAFCEVHDEIYWDKANESIRPFLHNTKNEVINIPPLYTGELNSILNQNPNSSLFFFSKKSDLENCQLFIKEHFQSLSSRYWSHPPFEILEIYNSSVDKKKGLEHIQSYYHLSKEDTIFIGDGDNDIGLFEDVGVAVAMGNASTYVKEKADIVTASVNEQGVLKFLKIFLKEGN